MVDCEAAAPLVFIELKGVEQRRTLIILLIAFVVYVAVGNWVVRGTLIDIPVARTGGVLAKVLPPPPEGEPAWPVCCARAAAL
jgi:hypothetical protein